MALLWHALQELFCAVLSMSLRACPVIIAVALARLALRRAPRAALCALWGVVGLRLVCPAVFPARFFPFPRMPAAPATEAQVWTNLSGALMNPDSLFPPLRSAPASGADAAARAVWPALLWLAGAALLLGGSMLSLARLRRRLRGASALDWPPAYVPFARTPLRMCAGLPTAFVLGLFRPCVYVPDGLTDRQLQCVLYHECAHLRRRDYLTKPLAFLILCLHWFNPLVWLAFILFVQDMEWACDEAALRRLGPGAKKEYSAALLAMARPRRTGEAAGSAYQYFTGAPFAFCEGTVKGRVKNVLRYKKTARWLSVIFVTLLAMLAIVLLVYPTRAAESGVAVTFPAYQDGRNEYNASIYDTAPFTVRLALPEGWHFEKPEQPNQPGGSPWTPMDVLDADGGKVGMIGFGRFEPVPELPDADCYKAAYAELRLGSLISWCNDYVPVRINDTQETSVSQCYVNENALLLMSNTADGAGQSFSIQTAAAGAGEQSFPCVAMYDRTLKVYMVLLLAPDALSGPQLDALAETATLEAAA